MRFDVGRSSVLWFTISVLGSLFLLVQAASARELVTGTDSFRMKVTAICSDRDRYTPPRTGSFATQMSYTVAKLRSSAAALGRLTPPKAIRAPFAKALALEHRDLQYFAPLVAKLKAGEIGTSAFLAAFERAPSGKDEDRLWARMGLKKCEGG